jgi:hypothetical protein
MPIYNFKNTKTGRRFEKIFKIAEYEEYLKNNPHIVQEIVQAPSIGDPHRLGLKKPDTPFRDRLKHIKKKFPGSSINTFD